MVNIFVLKISCHTSCCDCCQVCFFFFFLFHSVKKKKEMVYKNTVNNVHMIGFVI